MKVNKEVKFDVYFLCFCFIFFDFVMLLCPQSTGFCRVPAACQPRTDFQCVPATAHRIWLSTLRSQDFSKSRGLRSQNFGKYQRPATTAYRISASPAPPAHRFLESPPRAQDFSKYRHTGRTEFCKVPACMAHRIS